MATLEEKAEAKRWVPILRGSIYCAPRCGRGCTKAEYDAAVKAADALARVMGAGWEPEVWENLGWHYAAKKGVASVSPNIWRPLNKRPKIISYTVCFNSAHQVVTKADTPEDALGFAIQEARGIERKIAADCAALLS